MNKYSGVYCMIKSGILIFFGSYNLVLHNGQIKRKKILLYISCLFFGAVDLQENLLLQNTDKTFTIYV